MKSNKEISDREFDAVFQQKFKNWEVKPSGPLWAGIADQLQSGKKTREFPVLWVAAASMAAIIAVGLWLSSHKEPMRLTGSIQKEVSMEPERLIASPVEQRKTVISEPIRISNESPTSKFVPVKLRTVQPAEKKESARLADLAKVKEESSETRVVLPNENNTITLAATADAEQEQTVELSSISTEASEENTPRQKKIKSVGSLVNFVVSKVDKRKNKIIEFADDDEGTRVSGVNLGLLKFQTKDRK